MSRIYQGGQAEPTYQGTVSNQGFNPNQVAGNERAIKEEGQRDLQDLETQNRERLRDEDMESTTRRAQDQVDQTQLQIAQQQITDQLRLEQSIEAASLQTSQLLAKNSLDGKISTDKANQDFAQLVERQSLQLKDLEEKTGLGIEARALGASQALARQELQAQQSVQNSQRAIGQAVIQGLVDFGVAGVKQVAADNQRMAQEQQKLNDSGFNSLIAPDVSGTASVIAEQNNILATENAEEQAYQQLAPGAPLQQEAYRGPSANAAQARNIQQRDIGLAAMSFEGDLNAIISDPNTRVVTPSGVKSFGEIDNASDYQNGVLQVARQLTAEYGITDKNAYESKLSYANAVKAAMGNAVRSGSTSILSRNQSNRYGAALDNAAVMAVNGRPQDGWNILRSAASARYPGKGMRETNDLAFKDYLDALPEDKLSSVKSVLKDPNNSGSAFGNESRYSEMIDKEIYDRNSFEKQQNDMVSYERAYEVEQISRSVGLEMSLAQTPEESNRIRTEAISRLQELETPEALDEINKLRGEDGNLSRNNNVRLGLLEGLEDGSTTKAGIEDALASRAISYEDAKSMLSRQATQDDFQNTLKEAGLDKGLNNFNSIVATTISNKAGESIDITEARNQSGGIAKQLYDRYEAELQQYVRSQGDSLTMQGLRQEADKIQAKYTAELLGDKASSGSSEDTGDIIVKDGIVTYKGWDKVPPARQVYNPTTGAVQGNYTRFTPTQLPANASPSDRLLSRKQFVDNMDVLKSGSTDFGPRLTELSRRLTTTPVRLLEAQSKALGYSGSSLGSIVSPDLEKFEPTSMESGKNALKALGFSDVGAAYLAGNIQQESSWVPGRKPWDDGGAPAGGLVSWRGSRLDKIQEYLGRGTGKPKLIQDASPSEQLNAMKWEMKKDYPSSYRVFTNPNSTEAQLKRESYRYWGWGGEGKRFAYAESLITSGTHTSGSGGGGNGELGPTGALSYRGNQAAYLETASVLKDIGFKIGEHSAFGGKSPVHAGNSYHNYDEAFDITHWNGTRAHSIAETRRLKETVRSMNLFKEVIGPGDGDPNHETHLHLGGLLRQPTAAEKVRLKSLFK